MRDLDHPILAGTKNTDKTFCDGETFLVEGEQQME
jgi:hypothetical protein